MVLQRAQHLVQGVIFRHQTNNLFDGQVCGRNCAPFQE